MSLIFETTRLRLRHLDTNDGEFILQLLNSPGWLEHIGDRRVSSVEEAVLYLLTGPINSYNQQGFGLYLVETKETCLPIGICGLIKREELEHVDIGFAFLPEFCGKGYAYEAAKATLIYARNELAIQKIVSVTNVDNTRSIQLLKKLGMTFKEKVQFPNEQRDLLLFDYPLEDEGNRMM